MAGGGTSGAKPGATDKNPILVSSTATTPIFSAQPLNEPVKALATKQQQVFSVSTSIVPKVPDTNGSTPNAIDQQG